MGCKVAKNERTPNQRDDEDTLHYIQQHKNGIQKKGENEGEKRNSKFSTVAEGMGAERPRKKELTDGCYSGGDSQGLPGFIHPRVLDTHYQFSIKNSTLQEKRYLNYMPSKS